MPSLIDRAKKIADGASILFEWLGNGGECVDTEIAQRRTNVCLTCEFNKPGFKIAETVAKAIKSQVELRNSLGLRTVGIKSLKTCAVCECYLPLKIFVPMEKLRAEETDESLGKYPDFCWMKTE